MCKQTDLTNRNQAVDDQSYSEKKPPHMPHWEKWMTQTIENLQKEKTGGHKHDNIL